MKKFLGIFLLLIILIIGGTLFYIDSILKSAMEKGGTLALGTPTSVNSVSLGILSGKLDMGGLKVSNPEGYDTSHFLLLKDFNVAVNLNSLMKDRVQVPHIILDGLNINLEKKSKSKNTNVQQILDHLKTLDSGKKVASKGKGSKKESGKEFSVDLLQIKNVSATAVFAPQLGDKGKVEVKVPDITMKDVGSGDKGLTLDELSVLIVSKVLDAMAKSGQGLPLAFKNQLNTGLQQIKGMTVDLEGQAKTMVKGTAGEVGKKVEEKTEKVVEETKKLFKFK
jgi:uncharacterized protein involved in outer membrane biogenesis